MSDNTTLDLPAIEARLAAATPGPWRWGNWSTIFGFEEDDVGRTTLEHHPKYDYNSGPIIRERDDDSTSVIKIEDERGAYEEADLELIEHAPTDIAALISEVKRLRKIINEWAADEIWPLTAPAPYPDED